MVKQTPDVGCPGLAHVGLRSTTDESRCRGPTTSRRMNPAILCVCAIADDARQVQASLRPCCCRVECCCLAPTHLVVQPAHVSTWSLIAADLRRTRDIATAFMRRLVQLNAILRVGFYVTLATPHAPQDDGEPRRFWISPDPQHAAVRPACWSSRFLPRLKRVRHSSMGLFRRDMTR